MIQLGTETLHSGVFWVNEFSEPRVSEDIFIDVEGGISIQNINLSAGRNIILEAKGSDTGGRSYFKRSLLKKIVEWEMSKETLTLIYGSTTLLVKVPKAPMAVTPLRDFVGATDDDIYYGTITLLEVTS